MHQYNNNILQEDADSQTGVLVYHNQWQGSLPLGNVLLGCVGFNLIHTVTRSRKGLLRGEKL